MKKVRYLLLMIPLCLIAISIFAQQKVIIGKVTDQGTGAPLGGANILIDKAKRGNITKDDGTYSITISPGQKTLIFSFVGYASQSISVGDKTTINVQLLSKIDADNTDVVVIGY